MTGSPQTDPLRDRLRRQDIAYKEAPFGSWAERWLPFVCKHLHFEYKGRMTDAVRCTHGDEIIGRRWRRRVCMVCGRALRGSLPTLCWFTGRPHPSAAELERLATDDR